MVSKINRNFLFDHVRGILFGGKISASQVQGIDTLLDYWETNSPASDDRWLAYALGTAFHETAFTMQPIKEFGGDKYFTRRYDITGENPSLAKRLGNTTPGDGRKYPGRGFVQITGRANYTTWNNRLKGKVPGINLIDKPDQALDPKIAAIIIFEGMRLGTFTGKKLSDYFNGATEKWVEARRIVNGTDKNKPIAFYGRTFYAGISYTTGT